MYVVPVCHRFFAKAAVRRIGGTWLCNLHIYNMLQKGVERGGEREREIVRFCSRSCYAPLTTCS